MDTVSVSFGLVLGVMLTLAVFYISALWMKWRAGHKPAVKGVGRAALVALLITTFAVGQLFVGGVHMTMAQTATPVPLEIPINEIFTSTNNWMVTFAPIVAIGIGISLALAVFGYIAKMIRSAF